MTETGRMRESGRWIKGTQESLCEQVSAGSLRSYGDDIKTNHPDQTCIHIDSIFSEVRIKQL